MLKNKILTGIASLGLAASIIGGAYLLLQHKEEFAEKTREMFQKEKREYTSQQKEEREHTPQEKEQEYSINQEDLEEIVNQEPVKKLSAKEKYQRNMMREKVDFQTTYREKLFKMNRVIEKGYDDELFREKYYHTVFTEVIKQVKERKNYHYIKDHLPLLCMQEEYVQDFQKELVKEIHIAMQTDSQYISIEYPSLILPGYQQVYSAPGERIEGMFAERREEEFPKIYFNRPIEGTDWYVRIGPWDEFQKKEIKNEINNFVK